MFHLKKKNLTQAEKEQYEGYLNVLRSLKGRSFNDIIKERMNIVLIIIKIIKDPDSTTAILNESVKLIRHLASSRKVIEILYEQEVSLLWFDVFRLWRKLFWRIFSKSQIP